CSYCEDIAKYFFYKNYKVYVICLYQSLNLNKYSERVFLLDSFSSTKLAKIVDQIDPKKKNEYLNWLWVFRENA
mgnify:CR=1